MSSPDRGRGVLRRQAHTGRGLIIADSTKYILNEPTYFFVPAVSLILVVLSFNLLGDAIRDALDPKSEQN